MSRVRLIETTILILFGLLLAGATVNDVVRQTHTNQRLIDDLRTWRVYTGHDYASCTAAGICRPAPKKTCAATATAASGPHRRASAQPRQKRRPNMGPRHRAPAREHSEHAPRPRA
jgi:hypothetical protein